MVRIANEDEIKCHGEEYKKLFSTLKVSNSEDGAALEDPFKASGICVFARVRPILNQEDSQYPCVVANGTKIDVHRPMISIKGLPKFDSHSMKLHQVFDSGAPDYQVYEKTCKPLLDLVLTGGAATILAYGQTGSGKTHTMIGCLKNIAKDMFNTVDLKYSVSVVEILGNKLTDLFDSEATVSIKEDKFGRIQFSGLSVNQIKGPDDFLSLISIASSKRRTEKTAKNDTSSRSHMLVRLDVENVTLEGSSKGILYVVDLAGSENASDRKQHSKDRLDESRLINLSLMTLKDCMRGRSVVQGSRSFIHIPYRASKLTLALRECFELAVRRPVKVAFIACVNPLESDSSHSLNTLRYASGIYVSPNQVVMKPNDNDPFFWDRKKALDWILKTSQGALSLDDLLPSGNGATLSEIPEHDFMKRVMKNGKMGEKQAKMFYLKLWRLIVDARTKNRKETIRRRKGLLKSCHLMNRNTMKHAASV